MSACSLAVTVDGWQAAGDVAPTRRPGEPVTGTVHVWVTKAVRCDGLDVSVKLSATRRGYSLPENEQSARVFSGDWEPGEYDYRFEFHAPDLPTREGPLVGWRWLVVATADVPFASDPEGKAEFRVVPAATGPQPLVVEPLPRGETDDEDEQSGLLWGSVVLLVILLLVSTAGFVLESLGVVGGTVAGLMEYVGLALVALFAVHAVRDWIALLRLRRQSSVELQWQAPSVDDDSAPESGSLRCRVRSRLEGVRRIVARLEVKEYIRWKELKGATDDYDIHEDEAVVASTDVSLSRDDQTGVWTGDLPVPALGVEVPPCTVSDAWGRGLSWQLRLSSHRSGSTPKVEAVRLNVRRDESGLPA